jgi:NifU-like protein
MMDASPNTTESQNPSINIDEITPEAFKEMDVDAKREVIEALLDRDVRPMLIMDGGNMEILDIQENGEHTDIYIRYLGACSGCAASSLGTLYAIGNTLREKFGENIRVSPV